MARANDTTVTANEIAAYTGNAAAGLAGTGIDANAPNNEPLYETAKLLALSSFQRNQILYRDFKNDMDKAFKAIDDDALIPNDVMDDDRPAIEAKKKELDKIFESVNGDLYNNPKAFREFTRASQEAKAMIKHSQKWNAWRNAELTRKQNTTNPIEQGEFDKAMQQQMAKKGKDFWALPDPYAPITDYKLDVVAAPVTYGQPVVSQQGDNDVTTQDVDINGTFTKYLQAYGQKANTHQFQRYVQDAMMQDPTLIDKKNAQLKQKYGDRVAPIDPLSDRVDQIAAKISLADAEPQKKQSVFATDRVRAGINRFEAQSGRINAQAAAKNANTNAEELKWKKENPKMNTVGANGVQGSAAQTEAASFATSVMQKIAAATDDKGNVDINKLNLTNQELQLMGTGKIGEKGFQIQGLSGDILMKPETKLTFDKNKNELVLATVDSDGKMKNKQVIDYKQIANNKFDYNMTTTAGKEDVGRVQLTPGYGETGGAPFGQTVTQNGVTYTWNPNTKQYE